MAPRPVTDCCQVTTTLPDRALADRVAAELVGQGLAACAQVVGPMSSTYRWEGRVETAEEWYCFLKTTESRLPALRARLRELHPYEVPEIIAVPMLDGDPAYLTWIRESVAKGLSP
jgi:periplasmic divalent cation tolerance protein